MANSFAGVWADLKGDSIKVSEDNNIVSVQYTTGRGPFNGFEIDLNAPVINVYFTDLSESLTGVLVSGESTSIAWSNGTTWTYTPNAQK